MSLHAGEAIPFVLLAAVALAAIGLIVMRMRERARRKAPPVAPVPVPPEEVELEEGPVYACMRCGGPRVRQARAVEGNVPGGGANLTWICARCGHRGPPLEFDDTTAYRAFVKALNEDAEAARGEAPGREP